MGSLQPEVIIGGVLVLWYLIHWEYRSKQTRNVLGLAAITAIHSIYFLAYVTIRTTQPENMALLTTLTLTPPVFDLIRNEYPDVGVVMSTLALLMFSTSTGLDGIFQGIGIVLAILPIVLATVHIYLVSKHRPKVLKESNW